MSLKNLNRDKKLALYSRLIETGMLNSMDSSYFSKYGVGKTDIQNDIEKNFPGLLELPIKSISNRDASIELGKTDYSTLDTIPISYTDSKIATSRMSRSSLENTNTPPGNFKWSNENIPLVTPEYFVYDNSTQAKWEDLQKTNAYPSPKDNNACIVRTGEDDFTTYNNRTFQDYFIHAQGSITPKKNQSLDAWYDIGLRCVMYNNGVPYSSPNFQKSFYVWYINGDGTDYPYTGHVANIYPGQEANFKYKYESLDKVLVKSASIIKIKGDTPAFRYGNAEDGFFAKLTLPSQSTNCIAKVDMGLMETLGQRWHYQGFTLKSHQIFTKRPSDLELNMKGELNTLDITAAIDVSLTWEFDLLTFESSNAGVCTIEHDWKGDSSDPTFITGPTYIRLVGNTSVLDDTVTITVTARPVGTTYTEKFTFSVRVKQLYTKQTVLRVTPANLIVMVGTDEEYEVETDASTYSVSADSSAYIKLYKGKVTGVKPGNGVLTFKAQAPMSMPTTVKIPFTVTKYIPNPVVNTDKLTENTNVNEVVDVKFTTNCPRANISVEIVNTNIARAEAIKWEDKTTDDDKLTDEYPTRYAAIPVRGITEGVTEIKIRGYINDGDVAMEKKVTITVSPEEEEKPEIPDDNSDDGKIKTMTKTDAYISFHHQHQGVFTYLRSKGRNKLTHEEIIKLVNEHKANKIFPVPEVTDDMKTKYDKDEFSLALIEDLNENVIGSTQNTNPNYIDYKEPNNPRWGFQGNTTKDVNTWLNIITMERFVTKLMAGKRVWVGNKGTYVNDIEYPFPGEKGFGTGPAPVDIATYYGMTPMEGCWDRNSDNYGNYTDPYGSIMVYIPRHYYKYNYVISGSIKKLHSIDVYYPPVISSFSGSNLTPTTSKVNDIELRGRSGVITNKDNEYGALISQLILPTAFINAGKILPGIFVDKYLINNSKSNYINDLYISKPDLARPRNYTNVGNNKAHNNTGKFNCSKGDQYWAKSFVSKTRTTSKPGISKSRSRATADTSFNTIYIRNLLTTIGVAHASRCIFLNSSENCKWLHSDMGMPMSIDLKTNEVKMYSDYLHSYNPNRSNPVRMEDFEATTHNGQRSGVVGLTGDRVETVIGAMLKVSVTATGGTATAYKVSLDCSPRSTDFRTLSNNWVTAVKSASNADVVLPTNGKIIDSISNTILPTAAVSKGLLGLTNDTPLRLKNDYTPSGSLASIYTDVNASKVHNDSSVEYYKYHMGLLGSYSEDNTESIRSNYYTNTANVGCNLDWNMDAINIGNNRTGFLIDKTGKHSSTELNSSFSYYMVPLFGSVLGYTLNGVGDTMRHNSHWMSMTWYRVGYNFSSYGANKNIPGFVGTRLAILPDIEKIKSYTDTDEYSSDLKSNIKIQPNESRISNTTMSKNKNPWEQYKD